MRTNTLRDLLRAGKPTVSTRMVTLSSEIVEIIGHAGRFDFIELCGEYADWTPPLLSEFARAVELFPAMTAMMKVPREMRMSIVHQAMGSGIQNIVFADCSSAGEVAECISYVRPLTPQDRGLHGAGMRRSVGYVLESGSEAWVNALRDTVIEVMIESPEAIEQLDEILTVEGLDMLHFGPADYALSIGMPGGRAAPEVKKAHLTMIEKALQTKVRPRVILASPDEAEPYLEMGVRDFCIGTDVATLYHWSVSNGTRMRDLLAID